MNLAIVGSRGFDDYKLFCSRITALIKKKGQIEKIISGGAKGADSLAERYAQEHNIPTEIYLPDWDKHGRGAGFIRNTSIINACDVLIAFWDGESKGTRDSISKAVESMKQVYVEMYKEPINDTYE